MLKIIPDEQCTGCSACANKCPTNAISMIQDNKGFYYPIINSDRCIDCNLCKKTCPVLNHKSHDSINKCFACYATDKKIRSESSSGGIFTLLADFVLSKNGIVIGAAFDTSFELKHMPIKEKENLSILKGSKYLQSNLGDIFEYVKYNVTESIILFVGVPCQIAGLKSYLGKEHENLICVDLVCHGVPSQKLFSKYIQELEDKYHDSLKKYSFRDKKTGWDDYSNTAFFDKHIISEKHSKNKYMSLFLSDIALRECCYACNFKLGNKYADITLGDFWGIKNKYPDMYDDLGVSAVILNSEKGIEIFNHIKDTMIFKECMLDEIIKGNPSLIVSSKKPNERDDFFNKLDTITCTQLEKNYGIKKISFTKRVVSLVRLNLKRVFKRD
ncbi:MAG: Coenzyme F420 hydrogenase/dehydrogenase, beta subunit C-terminal domain [Bacilli bacterium]